jgi:hypothetical protein
MSYDVRDRCIARHILYQVLLRKCYLIESTEFNLWLLITCLLCLTMVSLCVQHNTPSQSLLSLISAIIGDKPAEEVPMVCSI